MAYTTINKSTDYFNTKLYTGTAATHNITGVGFSPDFTWIKKRENTGNHHGFDQVRGVNKYLQFNVNNQEGTASTLTAFGSDGFSLSSDGSVNGNNNNFVAWNWKANGTGSSNTDGSVTSTVSANTTSGFSICTWTGTGSNLTVGHGLGAVPKWILVKRLNSTGDGVVYHASKGNGGGFEITSTSGYSATAGWFNSTTPTSTVFSLGTNGNINTSGGTYVAYCWAEVKGFSKFGLYHGDNLADGSFVYTGFKPQWLMVKQANANGNPWGMVDEVRDPSNVANIQLFANNDAVETTNVNVIDLVSNGFKCRAADNTWNGEAGGSKEYVYMAFGQSLVGSNNVPCTAR